MPVINLATEIKAPIERCFDLSRSIDLHSLSTAETNETAVAGVTKGLIGLNEEVTWRARHFGIYQYLTSRITALKFPDYFETTLVKGAFKSFVHKHSFEQKGELTVMKDRFDFEAPFGLIGKVVARLILVSYMKSLIEKRNQVIKRVAESDEWKIILLKNA